MMAHLSDAKVELLVYGYLRSIEQFLIQNKYLPKGIKIIIIGFSKSWFNWNDAIHESQMEYFNLNDDNSYKLKTKGGNLDKWIFLPFKNFKLSLDICDQFEWEIKIESMPTGYFTAEI